MSARLLVRQSSAVAIDWVPKYNLIVLIVF